MLKMRTEVGDLGWIEYDATLRTRVRVGDRLLPAEVLVDFPSDRESPGLRMKLAIKNGVPACTEIRITSKDDGREVRTTDLRSLPLESWIEDLYALTAIRLTEAEDGSTVAVLDGTEARTREAAKVLQRARAAARRKITPELLAEVASVYRANIDDKPTEAVTRAFGVAYDTAAKYVSRARNADPPLLPPTTPGKRKA